MSHSALKLGDEDSTPMGGVSDIPRVNFRSAFADATGGMVMDWAPILARYRAKRNRYPIWSATINGRPLEVIVYEEGSLWIAENDEFNVLVHGESIERVVKEARDAIHYLFDQLVNEQDDVLSEHAKRLKQRYRRITLAP